MHGFIIITSPNEEDIYVTWLIKIRLKKKPTKRQYFNNSTKTASFVITRDQITILKD
jgi:hypothetical protein